MPELATTARGPRAVSVAQAAFGPDSRPMEEVPMHAHRNTPFNVGKLAGPFARRGFLAAAAIIAATASVPADSDDVPLTFASALGGADKAPVRAAKAVGDIKNLVILAAFADHLPTPGPTPDDPPTPPAVPLPDPALYGPLFNDPDDGVGAYFKRMSYDALTMDSVVVPWVPLPNPQGFYANGQSGTPARLDQLVADALTFLDGRNLDQDPDNDFDFAQFDADADGNIDAISILHSGYGSEFGDVDDWGLEPPDRIESGRDSLLATPFTTSGGVTVSRYSVVSGRWSFTGGQICRIGMNAHALGHVFGLPELGDLPPADGGNGIGAWCVMSNPWGFTDDQRYLPPFSAWCKVQLGWIAPTELTAPAVVSIKDIGANDEVFKISVGFPAGEYLLVENRNETDFNAQMPGAGGLAIWHIDENAPLDVEGFPDQNGWPDNGNHYRVALLQADGRFDLEQGQNQGDDEDLYSADTVGRIDPDSVPDTDAYQDGNVADTGIVIADIFDVAESGPPRGEIEFSFGEPREIEVTDADSLDLPDGIGLLDFGPAVVGAAPIHKTLTIKSKGTKDLPLGPPTLPAGLTVVDPLAASIKPGESDTFTVRMETSVQRIVNGTLSFSTQDYDEDPFDFAVTGIVTHFTPFACVETFEGWRQESRSAAPDPPGFQDPEATERTHSVTEVLPDELLASAGTDSLYNQTDGTPAGNVGVAQFQYVTWNTLRRDIPGMLMLPVTSGAQIIMVEWTVTADDATAALDRAQASVQVPAVRLRVGEGSHLGNGYAADIVGHVGKNALVGTEQRFRSYYYAKKGGSYSTSEGFDDSTLPAAWGADDDAPVRFGFGFDILDTVTSADPFAASCGGQRLYGLAVERIDVYSTTRARLGTGTVLFNQGEPSGFALAPGEPGPTSQGYQPFDLRTWDSRDGTGGGRVTFAPAEQNVNGTSAAPLAINIAAGDAPFDAVWDTRDFAAGPFLSVDGINQGVEVANVSNASLVAIDVWMSSPQAAAADNALPGVVDHGTLAVSAARIGFQTEIWGGTGSGVSGVDDESIPGSPNFFNQGRAGMLEFSVSNKEQYDTAYLMEPVYALRTAARRYTYFFEPQAIDAEDPDQALSFRPFVQFYGGPGASGDAVSQVAGTINIHRVVVTAYTLPLLPNPVCP